MMYPVEAQVIPQIGQLFSKDAVGTGSDDGFTFTLQSNLSSDQTAQQVPNGSHFILTFPRTLGGFSKNSNIPSSSEIAQASGPGRFQAFSFIISPSQQLLAQGLITGMVGITPQREPGTDCLKPRHFQGTFVTAIPRVVPGLNRVPEALPDQSVEPVFLLTAVFTADEIIENGVPTGRFQARLDGLLGFNVSVQPRILLSTKWVSYGIDEPIEVVVSNELNEALTVAGAQSFCTILQLQRRDQNGWSTVESCQSAQGQEITRLRPREVLSVVIPPASANASSRLPGTYRLVISFRRTDRDGNADGEVLTAFSQPIAIANTSSGKSDDILLEIDKSSYNWNDFVQVLIRNGGNGILLTNRTNSSCSAFVFERKINETNWEPIGPCVSQGFSSLERSRPNSDLTAIFELRRTRPESPSNTYRIRLEYRMLDNDGKPRGTTQSVISAPFTIKE